SIGPPRLPHHHVEPAAINAADRDLVIPAVAAELRDKAELARGIVRPFVTRVEPTAEYAPGARMRPACLLRRFSDRNVVRRRHAARQEEILELPQPRGARFRRLANRGDAPDDRLHAIDAEGTIDTQMRAREIVHQEIGEHRHVAATLGHPGELPGREAPGQSLALAPNRECLRRRSFLPESRMAIAEIIA